MNEQEKKEKKLSRAVYVALGFTVFGLGTAGIFLPVLPTVPLYLLTSYCFSKGSKKYEKWFKSTKIYKKRVYFIEKYKVMTLKSQLAVLLFVSSMLILACVFADNVAVSISLPTLSALQYLYFLLKIKPVTKAELEKLIADEESARTEGDLPEHNEGDSRKEGLPAGKKEER